MSTTPPLYGRFVLAPEGLTGVSGETEALITQYKLHPAYPNPFNPGTRFKVDLVKGQYTRIEVFNLLGQSVAVLHRGKLGPGRHEFTFKADRFASGIYFLKVNAGSFSATRKIVLLK